MLRLSRRSLRGMHLMAGLVALAVLFGVLTSSDAQGDKDASKGEKVRFTSVDGVELQGVFYAGAKRNSPTVMMLHALGEDSRKKGWTSLAQNLNAAGFSVLTFDFRGHGQSTSIDPAEFRKYPRNVTSVRGAPKKETLEFKDMGKDYYPVLVNDIAAAKAFLDNRNDTGACNTSSFVVLGADSGATLGAIWLNAEYHRFVITPSKTFGFPAVISQHPEGKDTIACVWLSITSKLGSRTISIPTLLDMAGKQYATPMLFAYSEQDAPAKAIAKACEAKFKGKKKDDKYRFTVALPIQGGGKLSGSGLLQSSLNTEDNIISYIKDVAEAKGNEWSEREFRKTDYVWVLPGSRGRLPAKLMANDKLLLWNPYEQFMSR